MNTNIAYHLTLLTATKSYELHLSPTKNPSNTSVHIGGRQYSFAGDPEAMAWLKDKINFLPDRYFADVI